MAAAFLAGYLFLGLITAIIVTGVADAAGDDEAIFVGLAAGLMFPLAIIIAIVAIGGSFVSETFESWAEEGEEESGGSSGKD